MKIETVTPSRPYKVITPDGNVTFSPGSVLDVTGIRYTDGIELLTVMGQGLRFEIPSEITTTLTESSLV